MPELLPVAQADTDAKTLTTLIVGAEGDLKLVAERLGVDQAEVLTRYVAASQDPLKAAMLLSLLQLLAETKTAILSSLHEFRPGEALKVLEFVVQGLMTLTAAPAQPPVQPPVAIQFNLGRQALQDPQVEEAADVILSRMAKAAGPGQ